MALNWFKKKDKSIPAQKKEQLAPGQQAPVQQPEKLLNDRQPHSIASKDEAETAAQLESEPRAANNKESKPSPVPPKGKSLFARLKDGLSKTRQILTTDIDELFSGKNQIDDDLLEALEELLITSDLGVQTAMDLMSTIQRRAGRINGPDGLKLALKQEILSLLESGESPAEQAERHRPHVIMVVGVNGVGKTTTIGKLAARSVQQGRSVLIAAADTFRAAATEQLAVWAERAGAELVKHKANADPAAVAFDSIEAALARGIDTVFVDTAGRLHTKVNLMEELKKIKRTIAKKIPEAPHEILLVLDATTGQNALSQAKLFHEALGVTSLALTKLDGTAKGGIVVSICHTLNIPLHYVGVGESIEDLQLFDPHGFVDAIF
jgi:fused signal recognition particle receptor